MEEVRLDKYLWSIRAYKTRSEATVACNGGKVRLNGADVKPSKAVKAGDVIAVRKGPVTYTYKVIALVDKRQGPKLVPQYAENLTPQEELDKLHAPVVKKPMPPKTELWKLPDVGEQYYDWGYHGGKKHSQHSTMHEGPAPHFYLDEPETRAKYYEMVREIVSKYKKDERICVWDIYNEAGNSRRRNLSLPILKELFEIVRKMNPIQPLTASIFSFSENVAEINAFILEHSDIITYHCYKNYNDHVKIIKKLKEYGRPIINTEWLGRCFGNDVFSLFPLFYLEGIGCINWGFVAGKYQTYEPYEGTWTKYYNGELQDVDFTKWFHDLYRPNHRPYDPKEIEVIREFCTLADEDFAANVKR